MLAIPLNKHMHYPILNQWYEERGMPTPELRFLPEHGYIVFDSKSVPICAGFLFKTDANFAVVGNIVSTPDSEKEVRGEALDCLLYAMKDLALYLDLGALHCSTNIPALMNRFEKHGFTKTDEGVSHFGGLVCR